MGPFPAVHPGRFTDAGDEEVTVFLIGMRFNKPWKVHRWLPVFVAMPRMIVYLKRHPAQGLLGLHGWAGRTILILQYWRSVEELQAFASAADAPHLAPWRRFMKTVGKDDAVGIWHETYRVAPDHRESVYVNMPAFGLAQATGHAPVDHGSRTAKQRMSRRGGRSAG